MLTPLLAQTLPHNVLYFNFSYEPTAHVTCSGVGSRHVACSTDFAV